MIFQIIVFKIALIVISEVSVMYETYTILKNKNTSKTQLTLSIIFVDIYINAHSAPIFIFLYNIKSYKYLFLTRVNKQRVSNVQNRESKMKRIKRLK